MFIIGYRPWLQLHLYGPTLIIHFPAMMDSAGAVGYNCDSLGFLGDSIDFQPSNDDGIIVIGGRAACHL